VARGNNFFENRDTFFCLRQLIKTGRDLLRVRGVKTGFGFRVNGE